MTFFYICNTDLSTWENCSPWDFDYNSIQNTIILADALKNSLLSKKNLPLFTSQLFKIMAASNLNIATKVFLPRLYSARTKTKHLADGCSKYSLSILVVLKGHTQCITNRISNRFNSTAAHLELYETCMPERFCESNEQLKESSIS